jgi:hypothetical protein
MSTQTLRHLCDAMDALDGALDDTSSMIGDIIENAQSRVKLAMRDTVDAFDVNPSATDQASWREGYEAALEDFDITEDDVAWLADDEPDVASDVSDEPRDDLYDAICGLFEAGEIDADVFLTMTDAQEAGGKPAVIAAADKLRFDWRIDDCTHLAIMAAVQ